jgi:hypothetical protein
MQGLWAMGHGIATTDNLRFNASSLGTAMGKLDEEL